MSEWLIPVLAAVVGALVVGAIQWIRSRAKKHARAKTSRVEYRTPKGKWRALGASARTEKYGKPLRSFRQRSQDYSLLLTEEDYAASGFGDRTGLVAVRWRENGHWVQATARPPARDRKRGDGLREVVLRRHC